MQLRRVVSRGIGEVRGCEESGGAVGGTRRRQQRDALGLGVAFGRVAENSGSRVAAALRVNPIPPPNFHPLTSRFWTSTRGPRQDKTAALVVLPGAQANRRCCHRDRCLRYPRRRLTAIS